MIKRYLILWAALFTVVGCGKSTTATPNQTEEPISETKDISNSPETSIVSENNIMYSMGGIEYSIPESWTEKVSRENLKYYYPEKGMLMVGYDEATGSITDEYARKTFIEGISSTMEDFELISESEIAVAGTRAYRHEINSVLAGKEYEISIVTFDYINGYISFSMTKLKESDEDNSKEFENILSSISISDEFLEAQAQAQEAAEAQAIADAQINDETKIVLGRPITIGDYEVTVQSIGKGTDYEGNSILVINYDFTNNSNREQMASFAVNFTAYQNGIESDSFLLSDDVDLGIGQKKIKPGTTITGVQTGAALVDDSLVTIELEELISFDGVAFTIEVDPTSF